MMGRGTGMFRTHTVFFFSVAGRKASAQWRWRRAGGGRGQSGRKQALVARRDRVDSGRIDLSLPSLAPCVWVHDTVNDGMMAWLMVAAAGK
jgi:hypothetical protein